MSDFNKTPSANRLHIGIYGKRNMGKSTLINVITGQRLAIISDTPGTTTDPVRKAIEISPIGPCMIIDTAGIDDSGALGKLRVSKTLETIRSTDIAILVIDKNGLDKFDLELLKTFEKDKINWIIALNKLDEVEEINLIGVKSKVEELLVEEKLTGSLIPVSALNNIGINELKDELIKRTPKTFEEPSILGDLINPGDSVVLVVPIDSGMPKGRLILPQVQTMRDILDNDGIFHVCQDRELRWTLENLKNKPKLVITDSQAFAKVSADTPVDIKLTSFSILFARYKGDLLKMVEGAKTLKRLKKGSRVLMAEACTHHAQPDDIGRVKIPRWIRAHIQEEVEFDFCAGRDYPNNVSEYDLIIHCGGCTLNRHEMLKRMEISEVNGVPILNYGLTIATINGILDRALEPFKEISIIWKSEN